MFNSVDCTTLLITESGLPSEDKGMHKLAHWQMKKRIHISKFTSGEKSNLDTSCRIYEIAKRNLPAEHK